MDNDARGRGARGGNRREREREICSGQTGQTENEEKSASNSSYTYGPTGTCRGDGAAEPGWLVTGLLRRWAPLLGHWAGQSMGPNSTHCHPSSPLSHIPPSVAQLLASISAAPTPPHASHRRHIASHPTSQCSHSLSSRLRPGESPVPPSPVPARLSGDVPTVAVLCSPSAGESYTRLGRDAREDPATVRRSDVILFSCNINWNTKA